MKLLTKELEKKLPPLGSTENIPINEKVVLIKYFHPLSSWKWYVVEGEWDKDRFDEESHFIFFGLVNGFELEWGYFSLDELEEVIVGGLQIERDLYFEPTKIVDLFPQLKEE